MEIYKPFTTEECKIIIENINNMKGIDFLKTIFQAHSKVFLSQYQRCCSILKKLEDTNEFQWYFDHVHISRPATYKGSYKQYWNHFYPHIEIDFKDLPFVGAVNSCIHLYEYNDGRVNPFQVVYYSVLNVDKKFNYKTKEQADKKVAKLQKIAESEYPQFISSFKKRLENSYNQLLQIYNNDFSFLNFDLGIRKGF